MPSDCQQQCGSKEKGEKDIFKGVENAIQKNHVQWKHYITTNSGLKSLIVHASEINRLCAENAWIRYVSIRFKTT